MTAYLRSRFTVPLGSDKFDRNFDDVFGTHERCEGWRPWVGGKAQGQEKCEEKPVAFCRDCGAWHCKRHVCACPP